MECKWELLKELDTITQKYKALGQEEALQYYRVSATLQKDWTTSDAYIVKTCKEYFPEIENPLELWVDAKRQVEINRKLREIQKRIAEHAEEVRKTRGK